MNKPPSESLNLANKRSSNRIDARIEVKISTQKEFEVCYSQNISRGGIFLETSILPDPNANIELVLNLKPLLAGSSDSMLSLTGRVVRLISVSENGKSIHKIGIQFVDLSPQVQMQIDQIYERLKA